MSVTTRETAAGLLPLRPGHGDHATVHVNSERCAGCEECVVRCPTRALGIDPARWVTVADDALCVGCRQCQRVCPYQAITVAGPRAVAPRNDVPPLHPTRLRGSHAEIRPGFASWEDVLAEAGRCLDCPDPTCVEGCPAHVDIPGFIRALRDRNLADARQVLLEASFLSGICSRVCDQSIQCEGACSWSLAGGEAVSIGRLERFVADRGPEPVVERTSARGAGLRVAVVGSGPAGMAAIWELLSAAAHVTVVEREARLGGVLRWGIPSFTLPEAVVEAHVDAVTGPGLELRTGCELGRDVTLDALLADHDAVVLAHGASVPLVIPVPGADLPGVEEATTFLSLAKPVLEAGGLLDDLGESDHVLVLGGGNTAMDVARTVRRLGAAATAVEWMDERFARVRPDELAEARHEGVVIRFSTTLERLEGDEGGVRAAWLRHTVQPEVTRQPRLTSQPAQSLPVTRVIIALGYRVDREVAAGVVALPLRTAEPGHAIPDRRWTASGIPTGPVRAVGTQALQRELGLAVAGSPVHSGWWARLRRRTPEPAGRFRTTWWARLWRRQAEIGFAAAPTAYAGRVWVAGDALVGPSTVVGAMAQGRAAARAVLDTRPSRPEAERTGPPA